MTIISLQKKLGPCHIDVIVTENNVRSDKQPNEDYISSIAKKILAETIEQYKNVDSKVLSKKSHDRAYDEAEARYQKNHDDNKLSLIEIAKTGNATPALIDYIQTKIAIKKAFSV